LGTGPRISLFCYARWHSQKPRKTAVIELFTMRVRRARHLQTKSTTTQKIARARIVKTIHGDSSSRLKPKSFSSSVISRVTRQPFLSLPNSILILMSAMARSIPLTQVSCQRSRVALFATDCSGPKLYYAGIAFAKWSLEVSKFRLGPEKLQDSKTPGSESNKYQKVAEKFFQKTSCIIFRNKISYKSEAEDVAFARACLRVLTK